MRLRHACGRAPRRTRETRRGSPLSSSPGDRSRSDDRITAQQDRDLAGRGARERLGKARRLAVEPARDSGRAVAQLHRLDGLRAAVQDDVAQRHLRGRKLGAWADRDRSRVDIGAQDVERLPCPTDLQAAALADREAMRAAVVAEHVAAAVDDRAGAVAQAAVALEEARAAGAGEEAEIL